MSSSEQNASKRVLAHSSISLTTSSDDTSLLLKAFNVLDANKNGKVTLPSIVRCLRNIDDPNNQDLKVFFSHCGDTLQNYLDVQNNAAGFKVLFDEVAQVCLLSRCVKWLFCEGIIQWHVMHIITSPHQHVVSYMMFYLYTSLYILCILELYLHHLPSFSLSLISLYHLSLSLIRVIVSGHILYSPASLGRYTVHTHVGWVTDHLDMVSCVREW